jgi:hypothetical protein
MAINQNGPQGDYEPRVLAKVPPAVRMGNDVAFTAGTGVGVGYVNHGHIVKTQGPVNPGMPVRRPRTGDVFQE